MNKEMSESGTQFQEIFEEHHDPFKREQKKMRENREKRERRIKEDNGI